MIFVFEVEISDDHHRMRTNIPAMARLRAEATDALADCPSIEGNSVECISVDLKPITPRAERNESNVRNQEAIEVNSQRT